MREHSLETQTQTLDTAVDGERLGAELLQESDAWQNMHVDGRQGSVRTWSAAGACEGLGADFLPESDAKGKIHLPMIDQMHVAECDDTNWKAGRTLGYSWGWRATGS